MMRILLQKCPGVPVFPSAAPSSPAYRSLVNIVLAEQSAGLVWENNPPSSSPAGADTYVRDLSVVTPKRNADSQAGEVRMREEAVEAMFCRARRLVEERRLAVVQDKN